MDDSKPKLALRNLSRRYSASGGQIHALDDVSLAVFEGEFLMLVGPSGCGKSTLLNLIAGLDAPDAGEILVDGQPVSGPGRDRTLVFQDGALFPWLTVVQNVEFGLREAGFGRAERRVRADRYLAMVGLSRFSNHAVHELSGGMKQRVALVRALVLEPKVLLMDEPFSALDAMTREDLYVELQTLWQERNTTVVFVTHNVREAVTLGDRVVIMAPRPGRVVREFRVGILRPRQIDDVDVSRLAQEISLTMKQAGIRQEEVALEEPWDQDRAFRDTGRSVGAAG